LRPRKCGGTTARYSKEEEEVAVVPQKDEACRGAKGRGMQESERTRHAGQVSITALGVEQRDLASLAWAMAAGVRLSGLSCYPGF
jgi:hypothetical protein